ncbi:Mitochondrial GTP/GDP carrier protein 1 [Brettanomyces nanus]|uniref:Mitochondrial GTP/GDP carrier protein 1 n=1 Tax=Eeniella nana TaxID=13502 RepID=A0A875RZE5_EENNA|nr:Mitochondrial GTP/GDP carrier protein 1 [Brettanomyces nanus]QPG74098.1 Mitochondrial GTP/GDP carrier protein 1 [Brettanomyces nanus]
MSSGDKKQSGLARVLGSASAGVCEIGVFHPIDTITKRMMSNQTRVTTASKLNQVIFRDMAEAPIGKRLLSLYPGLGYAACYKILQRVYKYGGQPFVKEYLTSNYKENFDNMFGTHTGKAMLSATAGSIIGIGEVFLLPLDVMKIKSQTNPEAFKGRGFLKIMQDEGLNNLYKGWGWTVARNIPGSFALFGGNTFAKEYIFHLKDHNSASMAQNFGASICGACASLIVSAPLDVVKTRIQNKNFDSQETGWTIVKNMMKQEGVTSFFKGLTPKLLTTGPKLVFSFAMAQTLIPAFDRALAPKPKRND